MTRQADHMVLCNWHFLATQYSCQLSSSPFLISYHSGDSNGNEITKQMKIIKEIIILLMIGTAITTILATTSTIKAINNNNKVE